MPDVTICKAGIEDLPEILALQKSAYLGEAEIYQDFTMQPLQQTMDQIIHEYNSGLFLKAIHDNQIIGSVRAREDGETCYIGKLVVKPELQNKGIGSQLLKEIENRFYHLQRYELFTGQKNLRNLKFYKKHGYIELMKETLSEEHTLVYMEKRSDGSSAG
jgi:ribosomal protein S18 acetylase RimI-like enzyme